MKQAATLLLILAIGFAAMDRALGWDLTYLTAYGAFVMISVLISGTFFWLYHTRATPLALGMCLSWAGVAAIVTWRWLYIALDAPPAMNDNALIFVFLAVHFAGAILHLSVILRSMDMRPSWMALPLVAAFAVAGGVGLAF